MLTKVFLIAFMLLNQNDILIQQHDAKVNIYDVDSYIHDLPDFVRKQLSYDSQQLEKDILGMLNMNIIYDYIKQKNLLAEQPFKNIVENNAKQILTVDESVYQALDINADEFKENYRLYLLKKQLYSSLQDYLISNIDTKQVEQLAKDRFLINKLQFQIPEKRDIGMIQLSQDKYSQAEAIKVVTNLVNNDTVEAFKMSAKELSTDKTVKYNDGQLGQFHKAGFRYPFVDKVFTAEVGILPTLFEKDGIWYILKVNEIIPAKPAIFDDHKESMVEKIKVEIMERQFQNIINQYAKHEVKVSKELVDDIFSRYEVFQ